MCETVLPWRDWAQVTIFNDTLKVQLASTLHPIGHRYTAGTGVATALMMLTLFSLFCFLQVGIDICSIVLLITKFTDQRTHCALDSIWNSCDVLIQVIDEEWEWFYCISFMYEHYLCIKCKSFGDYGKLYLFFSI